VLPKSADATRHSHLMLSSSVVSTILSLTLCRLGGGVGVYGGVQYRCAGRTISAGWQELSTNTGPIAAMSEMTGARAQVVQGMRQLSTAGVPLPCRLPPPIHCCFDAQQCVAMCLDWVRQRVAKLLRTSSLSTRARRRSETLRDTQRRSETLRDTQRQ